MNPNAPEKHDPQNRPLINKVPISSSHIEIRSVDMGTPILAMHSIRELGRVLDHIYVTDSFTEFYRV